MKILLSDQVSFRSNLKSRQRLSSSHPAIRNNRSCGTLSSITMDLGVLRTATRVGGWRDWLRRESTDTGEAARENEKGVREWTKSEAIRPQECKSRLAGLALTATVSAKNLAQARM